HADWPPMGQSRYRQLIFPSPAPRAGRAWLRKAFPAIQALRKDSSSRLPSIKKRMITRWSRSCRNRGSSPTVREGVLPDVQAGCVRREIWSAAASEARRRFGPSAQNSLRIQSAAVGGALQISSLRQFREFSAVDEPPSRCWLLPLVALKPDFMAAPEDLEYSFANIGQIAGLTHMDDLIIILFVLGILFVIVTLVGHGIWLLLAWIF